MQKLLIILLLVSCISCNKGDIVKPYSFVSVKFIENEDYVFMETTDGSWEKNLGLAKVTAVGYHNERFNLYLPNLTDTGKYLNPSIGNISYYDGMVFVPFKVREGAIHIEYIDSVMVRGGFLISFENSVNGSGNRTIAGIFGITNH